VRGIKVGPYSLSAVTAGAVAAGAVAGWLSSVAARLHVLGAFSRPVLLTFWGWGLWTGSINWCVRHGTLVCMIKHMAACMALA